MNSEDQLRRELSAAVDHLVDPSTLRPLSTPARRSRLPYMLAAAAAVTVVAVVGVTSLVRPGLVVEPAGPTSEPLPGPPVVVEPTEIRVDGLVLRVPDGLGARQLETDVPTAGYEFCLVPQNQPAMIEPLSDCLGAGGLRVRVASSPTAGVEIVALTGSFVEDCSGTIIPILDLAYALPDPGTREQRSMSIHCASSIPDDTAPPDSVFWELTDRSLDVQTPYGGLLQDQAQELLDALDLSGWRHGPGVPLAEPTLASASSVPPPGQPVPGELEAAFPTNSKGMTYGSTLDGEPDLVSVHATNGTVGFVLRSDMIGYQPTSPEDALRWQETRPASVTVPVWDAEYEEVVGEFVIGG